jgi:hypothetical protein
MLKIDSLVLMNATMKGINTPWQALDSGGVASFSTPRDGVSHLAFPALAPERNHHADSFPLAPLGNENLVFPAEFTKRKFTSMVTIPV